MLSLLSLYPFRARSIYVVLTAVSSRSPYIGLPPRCMYIAYCNYHDGTYRGAFQCVDVFNLSRNSIPMPLCVNALCTCAVYPVIAHNVRLKLFERTSECHPLRSVHMSGFYINDANRCVRRTVPRVGADRDDKSQDLAFLPVEDTTQPERLTRRTSTMAESCQHLRRAN